MNTVFHPARFTNLMTKHLREHFRIYLMGLLVYSAIILFIFLFAVSFTSHLNPVPVEIQSMICVFALYIGVFIFTGNIFSAYNHPRAAFSATMLPASLFEKYLLRWLVSLVGFFILGLASFHLSQAIIIEYAKTRDIILERLFLWEDGNLFPPFKWLLLIYCFIHAVAFLGGITFSKRTVIVTGLVVCSIIGSFVFYNYILCSFLLEGVRTPLPFISVFADIRNELVIITPNNRELLATISLGSLIILIWVCAFFKLKEREI